MNRYRRGSRMRTVAAVLLLALLRGAVGHAYSLEATPQGPSFLVEPPPLVEFTNDTGASVACSATGHPPPRVVWAQQDGTPLREVVGVPRTWGSDGALHFPPFPGEGFRQGVHDAAYKCVVSNAAGTVVSREVHVRAVVPRRYKVQVYDEFVVRGNTAVLRCQVPAFVRGYVLFSWRTEDRTPIIPHTGGRYSVLPSGELHIRSVGQSDGQRQYGCETRHRLGGHVVASDNLGHLFVTEPHGTSSPKVVDFRPTVSAKEGEDVELACAATAFPPPTYRWYRESEGRLVSVPFGRRSTQLEGSLFLQGVVVRDEGRYVCVANNTAGEDRAFTHLAVTAPLSVYVTPLRQTVDVGQPASFNCTVTGHPIRSLAWLKDGIPLEGRADPLLRIKEVGREDAGMYQCFVYGDTETAQNAAELRLGDVAPVLLSIFPGESVHPGTSVSLRCTASGNPLPQVTWQLDDSPVPDVSRFRIGDFVTPEGHVVSHVNVSEARTTDGGEYSCSARNAVGTVKHRARLDVYGPPIVRPMPDKTAVAGRQVTLRCPVAGYPIREVLWKKDGVTLPINHRQRLEDLGRLVVEDVQRPVDEGTYTCQALGTDDRRAEGSMRMRVMVPPVIDPALLPETLFSEDGKRARVMCSVTQGDPPLRIDWLKDGQPLPPDDEVSVQGLDDSSLLVFRRTDPRHSANYTCIASNSADTDNRTTRLVVNVSPRWSVEPSNNFAVVGQTVVMDCAAEGHPAPDVIWKKAGGVASDFRDVTPTYRLQVFENGSLWMREVSEPDAGHYLCQATNGVGAGISKVVVLKVHTPPRFETKFVSHSVSRGQDTELRCQATGEPRIRITWEKDKQPLDPDALKRLSAVEEAGQRSTTSRLLIRGAARSDSALYTCHASNEFGKDETNMQLVVQEPPAPPSDVTVADKSSRSVSVQWSPTFSGNSPVLHYVLQYRTADARGDDDLSSVTVSGTEVSGAIRGLLPATPYDVRVLAENALGQSEPSPFVTVTTEEEVPGGPPLDVEVHPTGSQSLKVTWKPPREELRHGPIAGYYIGYRPSESGEPFQYKNVESVSVTYLTNLRRMTRYSVIVQAYNAVGAGPRSDEVLATTLEAAPPTSPVLSLHSVTSSSITVTWDRPQDDTGVRDFVLHYKADGGVSGWQELRLLRGVHRHTLSGLRCGTGYRLYVTATNSLGTGEPGDTLVARTQGAAPLSPQRESFVTVNSTWATLHFGAWSSGGCPILYYSVHRRHMGQWEVVSERVDAHQSQMDVKHLLPNREYTIRVSAYSEAGTTEAEYRFTTSNFTAAAVPAPKGIFPPSPLPFHRNLALLLPVVISVAVLLVVLITVIVCLRKQMDGNSEDGRKERYNLENLGLSEFQRKGSVKGIEPGTYGAPKSSYYSSPARKQHRDSEGGNHDYAEPYSSLPVREESPGLPLKSSRPPSSYATVKRSPSRGRFAKNDRNGVDENRRPPPSEISRSESAQMGHSTPVRRSIS